MANMDTEEKRRATLSMTLPFLMLTIPDSDNFSAVQRRSILGAYTAGSLTAPRVSRPFVLHQRRRRYL